MRGRRLWIKVQAHGMVIPVYVQFGDLLADSEPVDAYVDVEKPEIVIKQAENVDVMKMRLHHELLHLCFAVHSGDAKAAALGCRTTEARAKREEAVVSFLEPVQFDILVRNGFLRYPKPPRFK